MHEVKDAEPYVPAEQAVHEVLPVPTEMVPPGHEVHAVAPLPEYLPSAHTVHAVDLPVVAIDRQAAHNVHVMFPVQDAFDPAVQ